MAAIHLCPKHPSIFWKDPRLFWNARLRSKLRKVARSQWCYLCTKTVWNSFSMSSTIWLWKTMWMVMLADSVCGRNSVGPKTMAMLWTDIRLASLCSTTLCAEEVESQKLAKPSSGRRRRGMGRWGPDGNTCLSRCLKSSSIVSWLGSGSERTKSFM